MRPPVPEHKTVYIRFHRRIDELLTEFSKQTGMRRATAVNWIQTRYMTQLLQENADVSEIDEEALGFSGVEELYVVALGRSNEGSHLGRAMRITVDRHMERMMDVIAAQCGMTLQNFRVSILVHYFERNGFL